VPPVLFFSVADVQGFFGGSLSVIRIPRRFVETPQWPPARFYISRILFPPISPLAGTKYCDPAVLPDDPFSVNLHIVLGPVFFFQTLVHASTPISVPS